MGKHRCGEVPVSEADDCPSPDLLRNGSAQYSLKVIARTAIPLLRVYDGHPAAAALWTEGLSPRFERLGASQPPSTSAALRALPPSSLSRSPSAGGMRLKLGGPLVRLAGAVEDRRSTGFVHVVKL